MAEKEIAMRSPQGLIEGLAGVDGTKPYLGNLDVVDGIVRQFVNDVLQAKSAPEILPIVDKMALIFAGMDDAYAVIPNWASRNELGAIICRRYGVDPDQNMVDIIRTMLFKFVSELHTVVRASVNKPEDEWQWQIDAGIEYVTAILTGVADTTHPEGED